MTILLVATDAVTSVWAQPGWHHITSFKSPWSDSTETMDYIGRTPNADGESVAWAVVPFRW